MLRDNGLLDDNLFADLWKQVGMDALLKRAGFGKRSGTPLPRLAFSLVLWVWLKAGSIALFARESLHVFCDAEGYRGMPSKSVLPPSCGKCLGR